MSRPLCGAIPALSSLTPGRGPSSRGNTVTLTLTGTNLSAATSVQFDTSPAVITGNSATQIIVTAPTAPAAPAEVTDTTPGGTSTPGLGTAYYTYLAAPAVSSLNPSSGPALGGTTVTLTGSGLTYADEVRFGSVPVPFTAVSDTQIIAVAPGGAPGAVTVVVHTPAGTASGIPYQYVT
ncbi:IPT/TIG domain-containing protein [Streptomyces sp. NPDC055157]